MIPDPCALVVEVVGRTADNGVTESDVIRWIGVTVAVAGVVLATPDGIAAGWRSVRHWQRRSWAFARRLLGLPAKVIGVGDMDIGKLTMSGRAPAETWQPWRETAKDDEKINILHRQIDLLHQQTGELRVQADRATDGLRREIREAEVRVTGQLDQLASQVRGERSQASRVDARGLGPIALGVILTALPDELASVAVVGWLAVAVAVIWVVVVTPSWLRDYRQALEHGMICPELSGQRICG